MNKKYKQNWEETRNKFKKWWGMEDTESPLLAIYAPKTDNLKQMEKYPEPEDIKERWVNCTAVLEREEKSFEDQIFIGQAYPYTCAHLGPGCFGTFLGANPNFGKDTVWYDPCFDYIEKAELQLDSNKGWYRWSLDATKAAVERSQNNYLVSISDLVENLDTLAALIGTEKLLYYIYDAPAEIHRLQNQMLPLWFEVYNRHYELIKDNDGWSSYGYFNMWGPGKVAKLQCDISATLSPAMFNEFVLPYLKIQCDWLDHSIYHLDGPGAVCHLDALLSIESLRCINWVSGSGNPDNADPCWDSLYKRILNAGKNVHAYMLPERIPDFLKRFGKTGILIQTDAESVEQAYELLKICDSL